MNTFPIRFAAAFAFFLAASTPAATITVNSTADPAGYNNGIMIPQLGATITLRDAVNAVRNSGGTHTITFAPSLAGQTISLSQQDNAGGGSALLPYQNGLSAVNLTLQGLTGSNGVTIARDPSGPFMRLFVCVGSDLVMTVNDLTFSGGDVGGSSGWGGAFNVTAASVSMNRCTFTGNRAGLGGAIYTASGATLNLVNCTIVGNSAPQGGGIYNYDGGPVNLTHTTITDNTAGRGGGLFTYSGGDLLVNTIIAGNHAYFSFGYDLDGNNGAGTQVSSSSHHNLIGDAGSTGGLSNGVNNNIVGANALLNGLNNNGGPTKTAALSPGSPALTVAAAGLASTDQRGVSRPQGAGADIGAYELVDSAPTTLSSPNSTTFVIGFNNSFNVTANGSPSPTFSASGALPSGVSLSPAGLLSGNPNTGTEGTYPLIITASNTGGTTTQSFTLIVISAVVVTTGTDEDNGSPNPVLGTGTSLREALNYAQGLGGARTITFAPNLAGQSIDLTVVGDNANGPSALRINTNITIQGLTGNSGITIRRASGSMRPFLVFFDATLTLNDLTIADGLASRGGGIYNFGTLRMNRCTLRSNTTTFKGGGLASGGGGSGQQVTLTNCTLANNQTQFTAGAISNDATSTMTLTNVTVSGNTTTNANAGMEFAGNVTAINTIVAGNLKGSTPSDAGGTFNASSHHNLIGTGGSGGLVNGVNGNIVGVPNAKLGALASNGGPTQTMALLGSPAFNAGAAVTGVTTDQRGVARPQTGVSDIGAYEFEGTATPSLVVTTTADELNATSDPNFGAGTSLREALNYAQLLGGAQTITFAPSLAGQTITVTDGWNDANDDTALRVTSDVTVDGGAGVRINLDTPVLRRLFLNSGTLTLRSLTLSGGNIQGASDGGALWSNGNATVDKVQFTNNAANYGGAIESSGALTVRNCTFTGNYAQSDGGAVHAGAGAPSLLIENSTFSGNSTGSVASAIASGALQNTYRYLTVANNSGGTGTIDIYQNALTMIDSIVAGNNPDGIVQLNGGAFSAQSTNNLLGPGGSGGLTNGVNGNQTGVPTNQLYLGSFGNNGGPTPTVALLPGSPAIDAGVTIVGLTTDQRGTTRLQQSAPDIGAFELVQAAAAIPIVGPLGGSYQDSVTITMTSVSTPSTVRYTLDGTTPSQTAGLIYTGPFSVMRNVTVKAIAYGRGWLNSPVASVGYTVLTPLPFWRNLHGLPADGSQDLANPSGDGVANLLKFAFNLAPNAGDLAKSNVTIIPLNGTAGLPFTGVDAQGRLVIEFLRRKASNNPGIAYVVETAADLATWSSLSLTSASVVSINATWERVTVTDPVITARRFGRVRVQSLGVYFNDFNAALGAATVRGDAVWTNGAVKLTDETTGGNGAVTFDGVPVGPQLTGLTARFNLALGPTTTGVPADGGSFAVGDLGVGVWSETGPLTAHHIAVGFDTYDNGGNGNIGIHLWVNGVHVASDPTNPYTNGLSVPVEISYDPATGLTMKFNGITIFNHVAISGFAFQATDKFGLSARTGAARERATVDDVEIAPR